MASNQIHIREVTSNVAREFVRLHHYAVICPPISRLSLGLFSGAKLCGVAIFGLGVRPLHTIRKLFPSLGVDDYLELNRLCVLDEMPRNTESQFLSLCCEYIRANKNVRCVFSWADGLRGKPGYVYQAASWLYGGFIKSQFYATEEGEVVHPRLLITRYGTRNKEQQKRLGLIKYHGYQFRYVRFLCSHKERKRLLAESPMLWTRAYPKRCDLRFWEQRAGEVSREIRQVPNLKGVGRFHAPASRQMDLWNGSAEKTPGV